MRGVNGSGPDPTPAGYTWTVDTVAPTATIDTHPANPAPGTSAAFTFHASEASSFQCSLVPTGQADSFSSCASGKTYASLANGEYTFKVRPTDLATNAGTAVPFSWVVDNSLADTTPPQTTITIKPADPSPSSSVSFGYESNELGSTFECSLDGAPFAGCPASGIGYSGLANGPHSFQVRAIDAGANVDPTPAGYSFSVAVADPPAPPAPSAPSGGIAPLGPAAAPSAPLPQTTLSGKPAPRTRDRTPSFRFSSDVAGAAFECAVDGGSYKLCRSPFTTKSLKPGRHSVSVRAKVSGLVDASPARFSFRVQGQGGGK